MNFDEETERESQVSLTDTTDNNVKSYSILSGDGANILMKLQLQLAERDSLFILLTFRIISFYFLTSLSLNQVDWDGSASWVPKLSDYTWKVLITFTFNNSHILYLCIITGFLILLFIGYAFNFSMLWKGNKSKLKYLTILGVGIHFYRYILLLPSIALCGDILLCSHDEGNSCYSSLQVLPVLLALIVLLFSFAIFLVPSYFSFAVSPLKSVFAQNSARFQLIISLTVLVYALLDSLIHDHVPILVCSVGIMGFSLSAITLLLHCPYYSMWINMFKLWLMSVNLSANIGQLIILITGNDSFTQLNGFLVVLGITLFSGVFVLVILAIRLFWLHSCDIHDLGPWSVELRLRTKEFRMNGASVERPKLLKQKSSVHYSEETGASRSGYLMELYHSATQNFKRSPILYISHANIVMASSKNRELAMMYLRKARENKPRFDMRVLVEARILQFGPPNQVEQLEMTRLMRQAKRFTTRALHSIHLLWRLLLSNKLKTNLLSETLVSIENSQTGAQRLYSRLRNRFSDSPTILRAMAKFHEEVRVDYAGALSLWNEAEELEEESIGKEHESARVRPGVGTMPMEGNLLSDDNSSRIDQSQTTTNYSTTGIDRKRGDITNTVFSPKGIISSLVLIFLVWGITSNVLISNAGDSYIAQKSKLLSSNEIRRSVPSIAIASNLYGWFSSKYSGEISPEQIAFLQSKMNQTLIDAEHVKEDLTVDTSSPEALKLMSTEPQIQAAIWKSKNQEYMFENQTMEEVVETTISSAKTVQQMIHSSKWRISQEKLINSAEWRYINDASFVFFESYANQLSNYVREEYSTTLSTILTSTFVACIASFLFLAYFVLGSTAVFVIRSEYSMKKLLSLLHTIPKTVVSSLVKKGAIDVESSTLETLQSHLESRKSSAKKTFIVLILLALVFSLWAAVSIVAAQETFDVLEPYAKSEEVNGQFDHHVARGILSVISLMAEVDSPFFQNLQDSSILRSFVHANQTSLAKYFRKQYQSIQTYYRTLKYGEGNWDGLADIDGVQNLLYGDDYDCVRTQEDSLRRGVDSTDRYNCTGLEAFRDLVRERSIELFDLLTAPNVTLSQSLIADELVGVGSASDISVLFARDVSEELHQERLGKTRSMVTLVLLFFVVVMPTLLVPLLYPLYRQLNYLHNRETTLAQLLIGLSPEDLNNSPLVKKYLTTGKISTMSKYQEEESLQNGTKSILKASSDSVLTFDAKGVITDMNVAATKLFKIRMDEAIGSYINDVLRTSENENLPYSTSSSVINKMLVTKKGSSTSFETKFLRKDDSSFDCKVSVSCGDMNGKKFYAMFAKDLTEDKLRSQLLVEEKERSESLLLNILPRNIARRLQAGEKNISEEYEHCTVLFLDMVSFTQFSSLTNVNDLVILLNEVFSEFDSICKKFGIEKIKTIGDAYLAVSGLEKYNTGDHALNTIRAALEMLKAVDRINEERNNDIQFRAGAHSGKVAGGVIGKEKFQFDIWGDTVNVASRMESSGIPGKLQISRETYESTHHQFSFEERTVNIKGKGNTVTYICNNN